MALYQIGCGIFEEMIVSIETSGPASALHSRAVRHYMVLHQRIFVGLARDIYQHSKINIST